MSFLTALVLGLGLQAAQFDKDFETDVVTLDKGKPVEGRVVYEDDEKVVVRKGSREKEYDRAKVTNVESRVRNLATLLDRMDAVTDAVGYRMKLPASEYFRRQCFVSGDPDETIAPHTIDAVGADCFMWATDYPHPDHPHTWVDDLTRFAEKLPPETRAKVLGENVRRIYRI